jgi:hypothetical protein
MSSGKGSFSLRESETNTQNMASPNFNEVLLQLIGTGRWKQLKSPNSLSQLNALWSCLCCGSSGSQCNKMFIESGKISAGSLCVVPNIILLRNSLCVNCSVNTKRSREMAVNEFFAYFKKYMEIHRLHNDNLPCAKPCPDRLATRKIKSSRQEKSFNSEHRSSDLFHNILDTLEPMSLEVIESMQMISETLNNNSVQNGSITQTPPAPSAPVAPMNPFPEFLCQPGADAATFVNFDFFRYFDEKAAIVVPRDSSLAQFTVNPVDFLLFDSQVSIATLVEKIIEWLKLVLFFASQLRSITSLQLTGNPAFFQFTTVARFSAQDCTNRDFQAKMKEHITILENQAILACEEQKTLEQIIQTKLSDKLAPIELFHFLFTPDLQIRPEAQLFALYLFHFPKRVEHMFGLAVNEVLKSCTPQCVEFIKSPLVQPPPPFFRRPFRMVFNIKHVDL